MEQKTLPKVVLIDGQTARYQPVRSILPPMPVLLRTLRRVKVLSQPLFMGYRPDCGEGSHRLAEWLNGVYSSRELLISRCLDCEMAEVRDISYDTLAGLPTGGQALRRRSELLGWYSGSRPLRRVYL